MFVWRDKQILTSIGISQPLKNAIWIEKPKCLLLQGYAKWFLLHTLPSARGRPSRQRYWKVVATKSKLRCFHIGKYLNHCIITVPAFFGALQHTIHRPTYQ